MKNKDKKQKIGSVEAGIQEKLKAAEARLQELEYKVSSWKQRHENACTLFKSRYGPLRSPYEPCPGLTVGCTVLGNRIYGKVTWVGHGGGVWNGQELCLVEGHRDVIPTAELEVVEVMGEAT